MPDPLLAALAQIVGPGHVLSEPEARAGYERDWTGRWRGDALAVVRPADTAEVAAVVSACARAGAATPGRQAPRAVPRSSCSPPA
jgi:FAD/FMN-containing dehydrogenase